MSGGMRGNSGYIGQETLFSRPQLYLNCYLKIVIWKNSMQRSQEGRNFPGRENGVCKIWETRNSVSMVFSGTGERLSTTGVQRGRWKLKTGRSTRQINIDNKSGKSLDFYLEGIGKSLRDFKAERYVALAYLHFKTLSQWIEWIRRKLYGKLINSNPQKKEWWPELGW